MKSTYLTADGLLTLLHLADSSYPTGAFGHSFGLEYAVRRGWIKDVDTLCEWSLNTIRFSHLSCDTGFGLLAWSKAREADYISELLRLDLLCAAFKTTLPVRRATAQVGRSFLLITRDAYALPEVSFLYEHVLAGGREESIQYPVAWGAVAAWFGLTREIMARTLLSGVIRHWAQVAIRILPVGQKDIHRFIVLCHREIAGFRDEVFEIPDEKSLSSCAPAFDLAQMGHETLHARYFKS